MNDSTPILTITYPNQEFAPIPQTVDLNKVCDCAADLMRNAAKAEAYRLCGDEKNHPSYMGWTIYSLGRAANALGFDLVPRITPAA